MSSKRNQFMRDTRGQSLVEFALILPMMLVVMFMITEFGRALYMYNVLASAARAISSIVFRPSEWTVWQWTAPRMSSRRTRSSGSAPASAASISPASSRSSGGMKGSPT